MDFFRKRLRSFCGLDAASPKYAKAKLRSQLQEIGRVTPELTYNTRIVIGMKATFRLSGPAHLQALS